MNWLLLTIVSAVTGSLTRILQKVLLKDEQSNPYVFAFIFQLTVALLFLVYTLVTGTYENPDLSGLMVNLVIMTLFYSLGNLFTFKAFKLAQASEVSIIYSSSTVWAVISAVVLLGESLTLKNVAGIILIVLGITIINYTRHSWKLNKGHVFALLGAMLFGIAFTNDAYIIDRYQSVASYMVMAFALPGLAVISFSPKSIRQINHFFKLGTLGKLLLCDIFYALSAITIFTAYKLGGQASIISPIHQTSVIFTVVLSYFLLNEKDRLTNKTAGAILAFIGILLLI